MSSFKYTPLFRTSFRKGRFYGNRDGAGRVSVNTSYVDKDGKLQKKYVAPIGIALGGGALVTLITMIVLVKKNKMVKKANAAVEYLDKSSVNYSVKTDQFTGTFTTRHRISSDSSGGGGGGHSSIGSSGGGHTGGSGRHF